MCISLSYANFARDYRPNSKQTIDEYVEMRLTMSMERGDYIDFTDKNGVEKRLERVDNHPVLKEYEVWMEGYAATGERGDAHLAGKAFARNFKQACDIVMCRTHLEHIEKENAPDSKEYHSPYGWSYDPSCLSYWGCSLFPREDWARLSFG